MTDKTISIDGMSCQHCVMRVKKALDALPGLSESNVQIGSATIRFDETKLKPEDLRNAIEKAGYKPRD